MSTEFALDLRLARRKTGLTQRDIAHLLANQVTLVSELERGKRLPTDRKSTRLNSSHIQKSRMPSSA